MSREGAGPSGAAVPFGSDHFELVRALIAANSALGFQPFVSMAGDELVVVEVRIGLINSTDLGKLTETQCLAVIEAPDPLQQALLAQDFVQPGDAAAKAIGRIKDGGIAVGDLHAELQEFRRGIGMTTAFQ